MKKLLTTHHLLLALIIILAALLRFPFLDKYPSGFSADEAVTGYSAYSILKTSRDEWGQFLPITLRSFGDFKPALYTYLTVPSIVIFGLSEVAIRLPMAIIGILAVLIVYFLSQELFKNPKLSILSALFLAISPWHIHFSRTAFEGGLTVLLFSTGFYFYLKSLKNIKFLPLAILFWGLNLFSYLPARLFTILMVVVILIWKRPKFLPFGLSQLLTLVITIMAFLLLISTTSSTTTSRFSDISIFNTGLEPLKKIQFESTLPDPIPRIFNNKLTYFSSIFFENYLSYFSPTFLFTGSRPEFSYLNLAGVPLLYGIDLIFLIFAIFWACKNPNKFPTIIWFWLIIAPIPAALTKVGLNANRSITFLPVFSIFTAFGASQLIDFLADRLKSYKFLVTPLILLIIFFALFHFLQNYLVNLPKTPSESLRYGYKEVVNYTESVKDKYDKIIFSKSSSEPQAFVAFYSKIDPKTYQQQSLDFLRYEKEGKIYIDQLGSYQLDKYSFQDIEWNRDKKIPNTLMVGKPEEFPNNVSGVKSISSPDGKIKFKIVESEVR